MYKLPHYKLYICFCFDLVQTQDICLRQDCNKNTSTVCNITNITLILVTLDAQGIMAEHEMIVRELVCLFVILSQARKHFPQSKIKHLMNFNFRVQKIFIMSISNVFECNELSELLNVFLCSSGILVQICLITLLVKILKMF